MSSSGCGFLFKGLYMIIEKVKKYDDYVDKCLIRFDLKISYYYRIHVIDNCHISISSIALTNCVLKSSDKKLVKYESVKSI